MKTMFLLVLCSLIVVPAMGESIPVVNGSFETDVVGDGTYVRGIPTGWSGTAQHWTLNPTGSGVGSGDFLFASAVPDGQNVLFVTPSPTLLEVENDVQTTFVAGTAYNIKLMMARDTDFAYNGTSYDVRVYWVLDSDPVHLWGEVGIVTHQQVAPTSSWQELSLTYIVNPMNTGPGHLQILIGNGGGPWGGGNAYVYFDNLRVEKVILPPVYGLQNGSFESPALADGAYPVGIPTYWMKPYGSASSHWMYNPVGNGSSVWIGGVPDGQQVAVTTNSNPIAQTFRVSPTGMQAGHKYTLSMDVGEPCDPPYLVCFSWRVMWDSISDFNNPDNGALNMEYATPDHFPMHYGQWTHLVIEHVTRPSEVGKQMRVWLEALTKPGPPNNNYIDFDNVRLTDEIVTPPNSRSYEIPNGSFEMPVLADGAEVRWNNMDPPFGWDSSFSYNYTVNPAEDGTFDFLSGIPDGFQALRLFNGYYAQTYLPHVIMTGEQYTLKVDVGDSMGYAAGNYDIVLYAMSDWENKTGLTELVRKTQSDFPIVNSDWREATLTYTAPATFLGQHLVIYLSCNGGANAAVYFDNLRLTGTTVAPSTCAEAIAIGYGMPGDFNSDCYINMKDVKIFADNWLKCIDPQNATCQKPWQ